MDVEFPYDTIDRHVLVEGRDSTSRFQHTIGVISREPVSKDIPAGNFLDVPYMVMEPVPIESE